nr:unnamed protein product [Callosobruchus chinensis]
MQSREGQFDSSVARL